MHVLGTLSILLVTAYSVLSGSQNIDDYGEISSLLKFSPEERESHISGATYQPYNEWKKRLAEDHGFNYLIEYGVITQWGSRGDDKFHADHELNLIGMWDLLDSPELGNGKFIGWFQNSQTLSGVTTTEMMQNHLEK